ARSGGAGSSAPSVSQGGIHADQREDEPFLAFRRIRGNRQVICPSSSEVRVRGAPRWTCRQERRRGLEGVVSGAGNPGARAARPPLLRAGRPRSGGGPTAVRPTDARGQGRGVSRR